MVCPKCGKESEGRFCRECGLDLGVYEELEALRGDLESLRVQLSRLAADPSQRFSAPAQDVPEKSNAAAGPGKPPPLPPVQVERKDVPAGSAELALGQKWFLGLGVLV